ncbi:MAG: RNA 3'-terminal phosphate cyclase [Nanoarchaeota archaeon]|nr:RNA 3'-terminal phosphate cyclase [Nanoarchaeota archaeon]
MIQLDGSYHEGGGQIVRTALALSTLTGMPFEVCDIRKGRQKPGLKNQHLYCIKALEELCNARTEGAELGSCYLKFEPGKIRPKTLNIDIGTAGSITLMLQALMLPSLFAPAPLRIKIKGGTDVKWAMPFDFFDGLFLDFTRDFAEVEMDLLKRGYYPKGGGKVDIKIKPRYDFQSFSTFDEFVLKLKQDIKPIDMTVRGNLQRIRGISHASNMLEKAEVAARQARAAKQKLGCLKVPIDIKAEYCDTLSSGSGITLFAEFEEGKLGADALGERGKRSEAVGEEAAEKLIYEIRSGAAVDKHLADNLIPILALLGGQIRVSEITAHTLTNIYTVEKFLGKIFDVDSENRVIKLNEKIS